MFLLARTVRYRHTPDTVAMTAVTVKMRVFDENMQVDNRREVSNIFRVASDMFLFAWF